MSSGDSTYGAIFGDGGTVLERVLLAIIGAHPSDETESHQAERLQVAMTALIGSATPRERDMERAVLFMARQRQKDICDLEMDALRSCGGARSQTARSVSSLATLATREILGITAANEVQATARVLCKMFRSRGKAHAVEHDHVREALEAEAVRQILGELAEWHIPNICPN